jgi:Cu-Zn family superoxide dismutase
MRIRWGWMVVVMAIAACGGEPAEQETGDEAAPVPQPDQTAAQPPAFEGPTPAGAMDVQISDPTGRQVGVARLTDDGGNLQIEVRVAGLPAGEHGIHVHAAGRCEPPAFESAGAHFTAEPKQHGLENPQGPHTGDMPNLTVGADGTGTGTFTVNAVQLHGTGANGLMKAGGTALVIHADRDDQRTDPSGNSGARIACGVISM